MGGRPSARWGEDLGAPRTQLALATGPRRIWAAPWTCYRLYCARVSNAGFSRIFRRWHAHAAAQIRRDL